MIFAVKNCTGRCSFLVFRSLQFILKIFGFAQIFIQSYNGFKEGERVNNRLKTIFLFLIQNDDQYITVRDLSRRFSISMRTAYNDLNRIGDFLCENGFINLNREKNKGIMLRLDNQEKRRLLQCSVSFFFLFAMAEGHKKFFLTLSLSERDCSNNQKEPSHPSL